MGRAGPPPPPPPDPFSFDPLPHPTSFPSSDPQPPTSDLVRSGPDLTVFSSSAGQSCSGYDALPATSGHLLHPQHPHQRPSLISRSSSKRPASARVSSRSESPYPPVSSSAPPPPDLQGEVTSLQAQVPAADAQLQADSQPAQSVYSPASSSELAAVSAAPGSAAISAVFRSEIPLSSNPSSALPPPDFQPSVAPASVLPLLASVLQIPATSLAIPTSSSLPPPPPTATCHPTRSGSSMDCSKRPLDTPQFFASAQNPAPIGSMPGVRLNATTKNSSANHHNHVPPPSSMSNLPSLLPPPPLPPASLSYAQAARQPRRPGFVRTHAADVESFARLPRTGANIICGSKEGIPSFSFVNSDLHTVETLYSNALIMKFHGGRPSLEVSHREIQSWGLKHPFSIGPLSSRAFLLRFQDNQDLIRVLTRPSSILITFPYKVFRWHNLCHLKEDSCYAPVWISLPRLPLQCFIPEFLESVANSIGRFLCFDKATTTLARPSAARLCVELDLRITPPPFIWVGLFDGLKQPIIYERMPKYCGECHIQGHLVTTCPKGQRETPNIQAFPHSMLNQACPPPARQNAVKQVSTLLHQPNTLATSSPNSQPPPPPNPPSASAPTPSPLVHADADRQQPLAAAYTTVSPSSYLPADDAVRHHPHQTPSHPPSQLSGSSLQRPDAASPSNAPLQVPSSAALLQQSSAAAGPSDVHLQAQQSAALLQQPIAAAGPPDAPAQLSSALLQRDPTAAAPPADNESAATSSPPASSAISAHANDRMIPTATQSSKSFKGKHKSINFQPSEVGISASLPQQQRVALEKFKSKLHPSQIGGHHLSSVNHFEALRYDHSDVDGDGDVASYYSDTDDGGAEHIELGYQSANGRSSNKLKDFAPSGMRINKRHPNMPLRVNLRSRKNSHPSTP